MAYSEHTSIGSALLASLCCGPIFVMTIAAQVLADADYAPGASSAAGWLFIMPFAVAVGFVLSMLPNLIGTVALHHIGHSNVGARLPIFWAIIGGVVAGVFGMIIDADVSVTASLAATGAVSACICRRGAVWS